MTEKAKEMNTRISVIGIASIPDQAGLLENHNHPAGVTMRAASRTVSVWPFDHGSHSLIVIQQVHSTPSLFLGPLQSPCQRSSLPPPKQQQPLSCYLAFPQARSSQSVQPPTRPHNWLTVFVYSPFCPLCLVPLADLALQPFPRERAYTWCIGYYIHMHLALQEDIITCFL